MRLRFEHGQNSKKRQILSCGAYSDLSVKMCGAYVRRLFEAWRLLKEIRYGDRYDYFYHQNVASVEVTLCCKYLEHFP